MSAASAAERLAHVRLVGLDMDNTLYDETLYFQAAFDGIVPWLAERSGRDSGQIRERLTEILREHGKHYHYLFSDILSELDLDPKGDLPDVLALFRAVDRPLEPFPGVRQLLPALRERFRLGLITSGMEKVQANKLRLLGLEEAFDEVVFSSTLPENKPSPIPFRHLAESLEVPPSEAVYVGDNPHFDFRGANEIGMVTVRVRNPEFDDMDVPAGADAQIRIPSVTDLGPLLGLEGLAGPRV